MNVAEYQAKVYPNPPCWKLVADVLTTERGCAVDEYRTITSSVRQIARSLRHQAIADAFRLELCKGEHGFQQIAEPVDFAVVLMGRTLKLGFHHCGIYYQGKVMHATPDGVLYQDMASLGDDYRVMEFWSRSE